MNLKGDIMAKISNWTLILITFIILSIIIIVSTLTAYNKEREEKLIYAMESKVSYQANRCYLENNCKETMTIEELINKKYLTEQIVNPITKEIVDNSTIITIKEDNININWKY